MPRTKNTKPIHQKLTQILTIMLVSALSLHLPVVTNKLVQNLSQEKAVIQNFNTTANHQNTITSVPLLFFSVHDETPLHQQKYSKRSTLTRIPERPVEEIHLMERGERE
jgi:hypothetical protein